MYFLTSMDDVIKVANSTKDYLFSEQISSSLLPAYKFVRYDELPPDRMVNNGSDKYTTPYTYSAYSSSNTTYSSTYKATLLDEESFFVSKKEKHRDNRLFPEHLLYCEGNVYC